MANSYPNFGTDHVPTDETRLLVRELYACGVKRQRIAERFDIDEDTLNKHYKEELDNHKEHLISRLGMGLINDALEGDQKAREFYLKCQGRWSYAKDDKELEEREKYNSVIEKLIDKL